jgi:spore germination cell wall hydrolase CwlJ-like protein
MLALRSLPIAGFSGSFWLSALCTAFAPTSIGYQDLTALLARQQGISERWHAHLIASPFGTIHAATFSFSRPIGTTMPEPTAVEPVNFDPRALDVKVWSGGATPLVRPLLEVEYPAVNRRLKGDRLPSAQASPDAAEPAALPPLQPVDAPATQPVSPPAPIVDPRPKSAETPAIEQDAADESIDAFGSLPAAALPQEAANNAIAPPLSILPHTQGDERDADGEDDAALADKPPEIPAAGESHYAAAVPSPFASLSFLQADASERNAQLYFGGSALGLRGNLERWAPGAEPVLAPPSVDPELKLSALKGTSEAGPGGETVAGKENVSLFKSPAERLGLEGKPRAKAEKCLADAVYFEARGEPLRGQMAVAQVVMNRVFSGVYPNNVCGVVYQNADRHLACQFTFACEGKDLSRIDEFDMWEQAKRIAKDMLDGKIWLTEVGHATHYHAYWVHPSWVHEMNKIYRLGVHTFYRPRAWGDGSDAPIWGTVSPVAKPADAGAEAPHAAKEPAASKPPEAPAKSPEAAVTPDASAGNKQRTAKL